MRRALVCALALAALGVVAAAADAGGHLPAPAGTPPLGAPAAALPASRPSRKLLQLPITIQTWGPYPGGWNRPQPGPGRYPGGGGWGGGGGWYPQPNPYPYPYPYPGPYNPWPGRW
jgi:hypothetical protein